MRNLWITLAAGLFLAGCTKHNPNVKEATVAEVAALVKAGSATPVDANDDEYRKTAGVVPGAVLLTSSSEYDLKQLPSDKNRPLVFYCTSRT